MPRSELSRRSASFSGESQSRPIRGVDVEYTLPKQCDSNIPKWWLNVWGSYAHQESNKWPWSLLFDGLYIDQSYYGFVPFQSPGFFLNPSCLDPVRIEEKRETSSFVWGMGRKWRGLEQIQSHHSDEIAKQAQQEGMPPLAYSKRDCRQVRLSRDRCWHSETQAGGSQGPGIHCPWPSRSSWTGRYATIPCVWLLRRDGWKRWNPWKPFLGGRWLRQRRCAYQFWPRPRPCQKERFPQIQEEETPIHLFVQQLIHPQKQQLWLQQIFSLCKDFKDQG